MSIRDYEEELRSVKRDLNAVICVFQKPGNSRRRPVNRMLETIIDGLRSELPDYKSIRTAYVYETRGLQNCIPFQPLTAGTEPYYMEPVREAADHDLDHVFFLGMALLEKAQSINGGECRLYLVTDDRFGFASEICLRDEGTVNLNPRFAHLNTTIYIYRSENAGGAEIEQVVKNKCGGNIVIF